MTPRDTISQRVARERTSSKLDQVGRHNDGAHISHRSSLATRIAFELAPKILAGIVNVNSPTANDEIHAPMGAVRDSGWGRTGQDVIWINSVWSEALPLLKLSSPPQSLFISNEAYI
jgi:hypothetical protein